MNLNQAIPFAAVTFVIAGMAAMGLPGFSGFVAELMIVIGAWHAYPLLAVFVGLGIVLGVVYIWRAMQKAFFSESAPPSPARRIPSAPAHHPPRDARRHHPHRRQHPRRNLPANPPQHHHARPELSAVCRPAHRELAMTRPTTPNSFNSPCRRSSSSSPR